MADHTPSSYLAHLTRHFIPYLQQHTAARDRIATVSAAALGLAVLDLEPARPNVLPRPPAS